MLLLALPPTYDGCRIVVLAGAVFIDSIACYYSVGRSCASEAQLSHPTSYPPPNHTNRSLSSSSSSLLLIRNQGVCGSCWAFSANGSLEASAARREAHNAYKDFAPEPGSEADWNRTLWDQQAIAYSQGIEQDAFQMLNLSVQELLDCDTAADQGCTGGNPLLSFYFIHRYGLTTWDKYPYVGFQDKCRTKLVKHPVATVKSWGLISPNHERHMELALRHIGPIAVGFNGAHPAFLSYRGGIFHVPKCKQGANHALLITGYGETRSRRVDDYDDNRTTTHVTRYWIARNSWGVGWGENGFVRIKRHDGRKGTPGVCGIARSPSVALDGILLKRLHSPSSSAALSGDRSGGGVVGEEDSGDLSIEQMHSYNLIERACLRTGLGLEGNCGRFGNWVTNNLALFFGLIGIALALLAAWPLTLDYRRRRHRRRMRRESRIKAAAAAQEAAPLVDKKGSSTGVSYGSNDATSPQREQVGSPNAGGSTVPP